MGQKVNPYGFRLGITTDHVSRWFSDSTKPGQRYVEGKVDLDGIESTNKTSYPPCYAEAVAGRYYRRIGDFGLEQRGREQGAAAHSCCIRVAISLMSTKLPWYGLPLYPALALMVGSYLASIWSWTLTDRCLTCSISQTRIWCGLLLLLAIAAGGGTAYFALKSQADLILVAAALALTLMTAGILVGRRDGQFVPILLWGTYITLLLLMMSEHWLWELAETYPAKPVGMMIQQHTVLHQSVYASHRHVAARPSLNFYSDRPVFAVSAPTLRGHWQTDSQPFLLVDAETLAGLPTDATHQVRVLGRAEGLILITRQPAPRPAIVTPRPPATS